MRGQGDQVKMLPLPSLVRSFVRSLGTVVRVAIGIAGGKSRSVCARLDVTRRPLCPRFTIDRRRVSLSLRPHEKFEYHILALLRFRYGVTARQIDTLAAQ